MALRERRSLLVLNDIEEDVLRQRRDLYAVSLALLLYYAAGGAIEASNSTSSILPIELKRPGALLVGAWIGWAYFLYRYWLLAPKNAGDLFLRAIDVQTRWTKEFRDLVLRLYPQIEPRVTEQDSNNTARIMIGSGDRVPSLTKTDGRWAIDFNRLLAPDTSEGQYKLRIKGDPLVEIPADELRWLSVARVNGLARAITHERPFTDYILPYIFAWATFVVGVGVEAYRALA